MSSTEIITCPPDWDFAYFEKVTTSLTAIAYESVYSSQVTNLELGRLSTSTSQCAGGHEGYFVTIFPSHFRVCHM